MENCGAVLVRAGEKLFPRRGVIWGVLGLVLFLFAHPQKVHFLYGLFLMGFGEALRIWAVGYIKNYRKAMEEDVEELTTCGPYAYTRNPLYLANGVIGTGIVLLSGLWWVVFLFWMAFVVLYGSIVRAEEAFLEKKFGHIYQSYRNEVPRFLFRLTPYQGKKKPFSWEVVFQKEIITLVTLGVVVLLFYLRGFGFLAFWI
ncbi:MAG: isoprenylcysteine carboxylmethyltransferase family protein [Candidatus Atribacteria bacterium]|nr:isoprenylcysteine carboxylmethyltransferase family protein [Candidatus Atribacteria bacterium]